MKKQKTTVYFSEREALALTALSKQLGVSKSDFIVRAALDKLSGAEIALSMEALRETARAIALQGEGVKGEVTRKISEQHSVFTEQLRGALASELDAHLHAVIDTLNHFAKHGTPPRPRGSGVDINNISKP